MLNHNKRSITLDTKNPKGKEVLTALIKQCDVLVEVLKDITFRLAPATKADALSMLDGIQAHEMLKGVRGGDPVNREALADVIVKVSKLVSDFPEIVELDLNPVFATKKDAIAADVRIVVDFDYKPRPAPRPTEEIVAAMNRIMSLRKWAGMK